MIDIWKPIVGHEHYEVSRFGDVRKGGTVLAKSDHGHGYKVVRLSQPRVVRTVHRLVAKAFIPNPDQKPWINHKDGNKANNIVSNLEWVTPKENTEHARDNGLMSVGETQPHSKLTDDKVRAARILYNSGETIRSLAYRYDVSEGVMARVVKRKSWKHV